VFPLFFSSLSACGVQSDELSPLVRQKYSVPADFTLFRIAVDDNDRTNIVRHFADCNASIRDALSNGRGVLVHCQAGVSRSPTLVAAFLMSELGLTVDGQDNLLAILLFSCLRRKL
jgi:protein-tyrosine phosphatase